MYHFFRVNEPNPTGEEYGHTLDKGKELAQTFKDDKSVDKAEQKETKDKADFNPCAVVAGQVPQNRSW